MTEEPTDILNDLADQVADKFDAYRPPDSFNRNLEDQIEAVCDECWDAYVERQWSSDVEGAELRVEVWGGNGRAEYFAAGAEAIRGEPEGALWLVSENGIENDVRREEIESISLTPTQRVDY